MTANQYKNTIKWTAEQIGSEYAKETLYIVRASLRHMGLYIPNGSYEQILQVLSTNTYMNWRTCTPEDAQKAANDGKTVIGINPTAAFIILPQDDQMGSKPISAAATVAEIPPKYRPDIQYYSYEDKNSSQL